KVHMRTLTQIVSARAAALAPMFRLEPSELANEAHAEIWSATNIPADEVDKYVRRTAERLRQKERRRKARSKLVSDHASFLFVDSGSYAAEEVDVGDLKELLRCLPKDEFEKEILQVWLGEHPKFD